MSSEKQVPRQPIGAGDVKKSNFVMLKNRPCKIAEVKTSKTGKHGHAKANITGVCVLTHQKCNEVHPASASLVAFHLEKLDYLVSDVTNTDGQIVISALDDDNNEVQFYAQPNNELCQGKALAEAFSDDKQFLVTVIRAPVQIGDNDFKDEQLIEAFREDKGGAKF